MSDDYLNINNNEMNNWNNLGYLLRPKHLFHNIKDINNSVELLEKKKNRNCESLFYYEEINNSRQLCRIEKFINDSSLLHNVIMGKYITGFVSKLLDKPAFLYKEKINIKYNQGSGYAPHQDATAYHKLRGHITCMIALTDMTEDNGCLFVVDLKNNSSLLPYDKNGCIQNDEVKLLEWRPITMEAGDCLFFDSFVPHMSNRNLTVKPRKAVYLTFNDADEGNLRDNYYMDRDIKLKNNHGRISTIGHFQGKSV